MVEKEGTFKNRDENDGEIKLATLGNNNSVNIKEACIPKACGSALMPVISNTSAGDWKRCPQKNPKPPVWLENFVCGGDLKQTQRKMVSWIQIVEQATHLTQLVNYGPTTTWTAAAGILEYVTLKWS